MNKLTLIATIHQSTPHYTSMDLFKLLERLNPEVIFEELPPELHTPMSEHKVPFGKEVGSQEFSAIFWYCQKHPSVVIPVDLPNRNDIYAQTVKADGLQKVYTFLADLQNDKNLSAEEVKILKDYFEVVEEQRILATTGSSSEVNSGRMSSLVHAKHLFQRGDGLKLLKKYSTNSALSDCWVNYEKWFEAREEYMAKRISEHMQNYTNAAFPVGVDHVIGLYEKLLHCHNISLFINP